MSLTKAVHARFWRNMGERFGKRWIEQYGETPTRAWTDVLDRVTPDDIANALLLLKDRHESSRSHPPTLDEFVVLLAKAASKRQGNTENFQRGFWRSEIIADVHAEGVRLGRWGNLNWVEFEALVVAHRDSLGVAMRRLLDDVCEMENRSGQRTPGLFRFVHDRSVAIADAFTPSEALALAS